VLGKGSAREGQRNGLCMGWSPGGGLMRVITAVKEWKYVTEDVAEAC
jgi:hypothetical protein